MIRPLDQVLDKLGYHGDRNRTEYKCYCPAHDDGKESLSVTVGKDDKVVLHCFAGCTTEAIVKAMGLAMTDLFADKPKPKQAKKSSGRIVAEYNYTDEIGKTLYEAVRFEPKDFRQRRPDGKGGWVWNLQGVRRVLYRLPELIASPTDAWVHVVEGEKDADNLRAAGLTATCNAMGAGKWEDAYTQQLAGRKVCILPDNDDPGRKHAADVANRLQGKAKCVRVLELPDLPVKGDVSDWLAAGGTAAQLMKMVGTTPDYVPTPAAAAESSTPGKASVIRQALADMGYSFRLNLLRERIEHDNGECVHDGEQASIITQLFDKGLTNKQLMMDVMIASAWANRYDPLVDFLSGLVWDGQDHIRTLSYFVEDRHLLIEYPDGTKRTVYHAWLQRWLVGAVARGMGDPVQNPMLVLAGDQGLGKSEKARWLCSPLPDYFVESAIDPDNTDHQRWATGNFIWAVDELGATTRKADIEGLKAFITRHEHSYRVPYARNEVHKKSRVSFIGTINPDNAGFLVDPTGNRRFLTVEVVAINWRGYMAKVDVRQVWAQAVALYRQGKDAWQLDETEQAMRDKINAEFSVEDPVRDAIVSLYEVTPNAQPGEDAAFVSNGDIASLVGGRVRSSSDRALQMDIARALKSLGVTKDRVGTVRGYYGLKRKQVQS
jgi:predicted P-loop ATPase